MTARFAFLACLALFSSALPAACGFTGSTCSDGVKNENESDVDCGGSCGPCKPGKSCGVAADCVDHICTNGTCAAAKCDDHVQNGDESDKDCGGSVCSACDQGQQCASNGDCTTHYCQGGVCSYASCKDGVANQDETDVDCGGVNCPACSDGQTCKVAGDCASDVCKGGRCLPAACDDQVQNGSETSVDCGGGCPCKDGSACGKPEDCLSLVCAAGTCQVPSCTDGVANGAEGDVDCGGGCTPCVVGQACKVDTDCVDGGLCVGHVCQPPRCTDGAKNGIETGVDCGGGACPPCADLAGCTVPSDCTSGVCKNLVCQIPTCGDQLKNGSETDKDCGGSCGGCPDGKACLVGSDCANGVCAGTPPTCQSPSCTDGVKNGSETDIDCGGSCNPCPDRAPCSKPSDCSSGVCTAGACRPASCGDGVKNGDETDVDCGGTCAPCANGLHCNGGKDCLSGACATASVCAAWVDTFPIASGSPGAHALAADDAGNLLVATQASSGPVTIGSTPVSTDENVVGKFTPSGAVTWVALPNAGCSPDRVAAAPGSGDVVSTTKCAGSFVVFKLASADGALRWSKSFSASAGGSYINSLAVDKAGNVFFAGLSSDASIAFGGPPLVNPSGGATPLVIVAKLSAADGSHLWSRGFSGVDFMTPATIAVDGKGDVVIGYSGVGSVDFGGGTLASAGGAFVAKLNGADGSHAWSRSFYNPFASSPVKMAVDPAGSVLLATTSELGADFGGGPIGGPGVTSLLLAKYDGGSGAHLWSHLFGPAPINGGNGIWLVADALGNPVVAATFGSNIDLGSGPIANTDPTGTTSDIFAASFDGATGTLRSVAGFGSSGIDYLEGLAVAPSGNVALFGFFATTMHFGSLSVAPTAGGNTMFLGSVGGEP